MKRKIQARLENFEVGPCVISNNFLKSDEWEFPVLPGAWQIMN